MRLSQRELATIAVALRFWRAHVKAVGNPTTLSDLFARHLPLSPKEIDRLTDRLSNCREIPLVSSDWSPQCTTVPTFYGHREKREPNQSEFDSPFVPVLIGESEGIRLILGTDDPGDTDKPDIHIERRPHGWAFFLHPNAGDPVALIYMLDDGRTYVVPELHTDPSVELVREIPTEIDAI